MDNRIPDVLNEVKAVFITRLPITDAVFLSALRDKKVLTGAERNDLDSKPNAKEKRSFLLDALTGKQSINPYMAFRKILGEKAPDLFKLLEEAEKEYGFGKSLIVFVCQADCGIQYCNIVLIL